MPSKRDRKSMSSAEKVNRARRDENSKDMFETIRKEVARDAAKRQKDRRKQIRIMIGEI